MPRRRKNPETANLEKLKVYPTYVGTILAPKSKIPVAVYVGPPSERFFLFTPDRKLGIGAGYYGDEVLDQSDTAGCVRQHMFPGLLSKADIGTGLGTTLYLGGNMVAAASDQDDNGEFPWEVHSNQCTYSIEGDRSAAADRAWENMNRHGLSTTGHGETESVSENYDVDYFVSEDEVGEHFAEQHEGADIDSVTVRGEVEVEGYISQTADIMEWGTVKESGLIMHLSEFFGDAEDHMFIPPQVFATSNWKHTPDDWFIRYAQQNAESAKQYSRASSGADWIREAACHFGRGTQHGELLLELIGEQSQLQLPQTKRMRNDLCPTTFRTEAMAWEQRFGASFVEDSAERNRNRGRRRGRKRPSVAKLKNKLLR